MKTIQKGIMLMAGVMLTVSMVFAQGDPLQDPKYGDDLESRQNCASNLSSMSEFYKIKVYEYAYEPWQKAFRNCPGASKNIYIQGRKIIEYKIGEATDPVVKEAYIDTLLLLFDKRIEHFGEEGKVLGKKGNDVLKYRRDNVEEAYGYFKKSVELDKEECDAGVAANLVTLSAALFKGGVIEADELINNYMVTMEYVQAQKQTSKAKRAIASIEKDFAGSGAADCEALVNIFTPKYEAEPTNKELLEKITDLLGQADCKSSELYSKAAVSLYEIEPSAIAAAKLANMFQERDQMEKALEFLLKATELETDANAKADYFYQIATLKYSESDYVAVKEYANKALASNPNYGKAYMIIGNAYAAGGKTCGADKFEKAAVYLAVVDKFMKAKQVDPTVTEDANAKIANYSKYFPNNEDAFFRGFEDGKSYTVGCWINENTTIRTIKNQ